MNQKDQNPYPQLALRLGKDSRMLVGDFDTGSSKTFLSYEWLVDNELIQGKTLFSSFKMIGGRGLFHAAFVILDAQLIAGDTVTGVSSIQVYAVRDWDHCQFSNGMRWALFGRDILRMFGASVEIDGRTGETRITTQNWQTFEIEVANLFRSRGLSVQRDYNLDGNQVDIFLSEKTRSGKELRTIVECKFHRKPVGNQYVRNLSNLFEFAKSAKLAEHAILVSSSGFSKDARLVAASADIGLVEIDDLRAKASPSFSQLVVANHEQKKTTSKSAFIIMPFSSEFQDIYMLGIRETLAKHGFACRRVDEVEFNGRIMDQIRDMIQMSDIIVSEVSEPNPNVYYELGIAHATGKDVILCTRNVRDIPFDIRDLNHIVYNNIMELREKLSKRIETLVIPVDDIK